MQIEWKSENVSPYLFRQSISWPGLHVHRAHVLPGRMPEQTNSSHDVNIAISGTLTTERFSSVGKRIVRKGYGGSLCITPSGQPISARWEKPLDILGISLDPQFVAQAAADNYFSPTFEFADVYKDADPLIQHIGLTLLAESESETPSGKLFSDSLIHTLMLHLLRNYSTATVKRESPNGGLSGYKLRRVREFIAANLEEDLSLAEISAVAELSQFHFARAFRKTTGLTPQQFLMQQRIERAKELLAKDELPIVEISLRTGFKNQSHFTTLFRKFTKLTPKTWRDLKLA